MAAEPEFSYAIGVALVSSATYAGSGRRALRPRPILALRHGRFGLSTSRGRALLGFGEGPAEPGMGQAESGLSADVLASERFRFGASLRTSAGRDPSDDPVLAGLPEIRSTIEARLYLNYAISRRWTLGASLSQDMLGREGGAAAAIDLGYRDRITPFTEWTVGGGVGFANARRMQTYFGVPPSTASGHPPFTPGAGLQDVRWGLGITTALSSRWVVHATLGRSRLLGAAAASPLTVRPASASASVGLVYRCCGQGMVHR